MRATTDDGASIVWTETGPPDGDALLLLHSLGTNRDMWAPQAAALSDTHRVLTIDTRGHGESDATRAPYDLGRLGSDVISLADTAGVGTFHVCGVSLGGQMALWLGVNHPGRLLSLTAANTAAKIGTRDRWDERIDAISSGGMRSMRDQVMSGWFSSDFASRHPDRYEAAATWFDSTDPAGYIGCCSALAAADLRADVGGIDVPTLIVGSTLDMSTPVAEAEWLRAQISGSRLAIIDGAAHLSNLDRDATFTGHLRGFLETAGQS